MWKLSVNIRKQRLQLERVEYETIYARNSWTGGKRLSFLQHYQKEGKEYTVLDQQQHYLVVKSQEEVDGCKYVKEKEGHDEGKEPVNAKRDVSCVSIAIGDRTAEDKDNITYT